MNISIKSFVQWTRKADSDSGRFRKSMAKALRGASAYLWRVAKNSIKTRTRKRTGTYIDEHGRSQTFTGYVPSPPGSPPYSHQPSGSWKKSFRFYVDEENLTAYVGPENGRGHIAPVHEYGLHDTVVWREYTWAGYRKRKTILHRKTVKYTPRPTMGRALASARPYISRYWSQVFTQ